MPSFQSLEQGAALTELWDYLVKDVWKKYWNHYWTRSIRLKVASACSSGLYHVYMTVRVVLGFLQNHPQLYAIFAAILAWLDPGIILTLVKYFAAGVAGHFILGLASIRWFEQYREETLPLIKILGFEFTVRNAVDYKLGILKQMFTALCSCAKKTVKKTKKVRFTDSQTWKQQNDSISMEPTKTPDHPVMIRTDGKHVYNVSSSGLFLKPTYNDGTSISTPRLSYTSDIIVPKAGVLFLQDDPSDTIEYRRTILHVEVTKQLLDRVDHLIHGLTSVLLDLSPPNNNAARNIQLRISDEHRLHTLADQIRKLVYNRTDKKHFDHAWWHERNYPPMLTAKDIEELSTWVKICLHMLVTKKRVKLQTVLDEANSSLLKQLFKTGISKNKPRGRRVRAEETLRMDSMAVASGVLKKPYVEKVVGGVKYSGIAGDLAGLVEVGLQQFRECV